MKIITFLIVAGGLMPLACLSQNIDGQGRKHGQWKVFLDASVWKPTSDSASSGFWRYTVFHHGENLCPIESRGKKGYTLEYAKELNDSAKGPKMLDGEYVWFDNNGRISSVHNFKNGYYVSCREFRPDGSLKRFFDYGDQQNSPQHGWSVYLYDKEGVNSAVYQMKQAKNGEWKLSKQIGSRNG